MGVPVGRGVSDGGTVAEGRAGVSVGGIALGVGEEQEMRRKMQKVENRLVLSEVEGICFAACLCMGGF